MVTTTCLKTHTHTHTTHTHTHFTQTIYTLTHTKQTETVANHKDHIRQKQQDTINIYLHIFKQTRFFTFHL